MRNLVKSKYVLGTVALISTSLMLTACTVSIDVTGESESPQRDDSVPVSDTSLMDNSDNNEEDSISSVPNFSSSANSISTPPSSIDGTAIEGYIVTLNDGSAIDLTTITQVRYENRFDETPDTTYHIFDINQEQIQELATMLEPETWRHADPPEYGVDCSLECLLENGEILYIYIFESQISAGAQTCISVTREDEAGNKLFHETFTAPLRIHENIIEFKNEITTKK